MLKPSTTSYKIEWHKKKLKDLIKESSSAINFAPDPVKLKEMGYHRFILSSLERQEKARIATLPWANAGQILHGEYRRDWTEEELEEQKLVGVFTPTIKGVDLAGGPDRTVKLEYQRIGETVNIKSKEEKWEQEK